MTKREYESQKESPEKMPKASAQPVAMSISTSDTLSVTQVGDRIVLDPRNAFEAQIIKMVEIHRKKKADYAGNDHPNVNFYDTARQLGQTGGHSVEALIATKQARLRVLLPQFWKSGKGPLNEGIFDTLLDRAVYAVIALTIWSEDGYEQDHPNQKAAG